MVVKGQIQKILNRLVSLYSQSSDIYLTLFYSKLAIIELCGWVELSMDEIVYKYTNKYLCNPAHITKIEEIVDRNSGFDYEKNFKKMLISVIGLHGVEKIESRIDPVILQRFKSNLGSLRVPRNTAAHTYISGTTITIDSPAVTLNKLSHIHIGLREFEIKINKLYKLKIKD